MGNGAITPKSPFRKLSRYLCRLQWQQRGGVIVTYSFCLKCQRITHVVCLPSEGDFFNPPVKGKKKLRGNKRASWGGLKMFSEGTFEDGTH